MGAFEAVFADLFPRTHLPPSVIFVRLVLALALGAVIGLEREVRNRPAGLRTHMLVSLASALFAIVMIEVLYSEIGGIETVRIEPIQVIQAVTTGIAFLGAGVIIQSRGEVQGITTATALWLAGAIGVAAGMGYGLIAAVATILSLVVLTAVKGLESRLPKTAPDEKPAAKTEGKKTDDE
jgi:putative Mg2+ transporter-C (MgtC) family protein